MERASVVKASPLLCRRASPNCGISFFITRSRLARWRQASSQYAGTSRAKSDTAGAAATLTMSGLHPAGAFRAVLQRDAEVRELLADAVGGREVLVLLGLGAGLDARLDLGVGQRGAGLQEGLRLLLQHAQRRAERAQQPGRRDGLRAVQVGDHLEQHGERPGRVE